MSTLAIVLIVIGVIVLIALVLGILGTRARDRRQAPAFDERVRAADAALAQAAALDRRSAPRLALLFLGARS